MARVAERSGAPAFASGDAPDLVPELVYCESYSSESSVENGYIIQSVKMVISFKHQNRTDMMIT